MTTPTYVCRKCGAIVAVVYLRAGPHFAWCEACMTLYRSKPPDPALPGLADVLNEVKPRARARPKKSKTPKHKE